MDTKQCRACKRELPLDVFHKAKNNKDGHSSLCKECKSKEDKEYRDKNKERIREKNKRYRDENKEAINERKRQYYYEHKDEVLLKCAEYRATHKEEKAKVDKKYAEEHKEQIQQYQKEYRATHKLSNSEYQKQYRVKNKERLDEYKKSPHVRYTVYQHNAEKKNRTFDLSEGEFITMSQQPCIYCGEYSDTYQGEWFNGIDRVDSSMGYQKDNCVPCCSTCNRMKMDLPVNDWISKMKQIINYYST